MHMGRLLLCSVLALWGLASACDRAPAPAAERAPRGVPVKIAEVRSAEIQETSEYVATLRSRRTVTVLPQVSGRLKEIFVRSGDAVRAGQPLMQIDPAEQEAAVRSQEASRLSRQAALQYAREQYERMKTLFAQGIVSRQQLDQAKSDLDARQAEVDALEAQVRQARVLLQYFRVTAPVDGIVGDIPVREGDYVTTSTTLTSVGQNRTLEVYISVPIERAAALRLGMPVLLVDGAGKVIAGSRVTFIAPQVDDATQSVLVKAVIDNPDGNLRTEQFVRARVVWGARTGPVIPALAVVRVGGQTFAFVVEGRDGSLVARQRPIRVGELVGNDYVVLDGLKPGERIVVSGIQRLADGAPVIPER